MTTVTAVTSSRRKPWRLSDTSREIVELVLTVSKFAIERRGDIHRDADLPTILECLSYPAKRWCPEKQKAIFLGLNEFGRMLVRQLALELVSVPTLKMEMTKLANRHERAHYSVIALNARLVKAKSEEHKQEILKRNFREQGTE